MADAPGQPPVVAESLQTHTPLDPRAETPALTREHGEELRQQWLNQPPTAPARSAHHTTPRAHKPASGARGRARWVQCNTMDGGMIPRSSLGLIRTSPLRQCFCVAFPSRTTPRNRRSTGPLGTGGNRRRSTGEELCITTSTCGLSPH